MEYKFLNFDDVLESITEIYNDCLSEVEQCRYESCVEDYAYLTAENVCNDMDKYVHMEDTKMWGNFANIRQDWDITKNFVKSEVEPWGKFDDIIKSIDDNTISKEDLEKFQTWALDWFFTAFGTYNLKYNFNNFIYEIIDNEEQEED